jgi:hypothetical protein
MKQLTVDWDNPQDLTKTISILHQRKRELEGYIGKKEKAKEKLSLMRDIWQSEVPLKGSQLSSEPIFYVYAHFVKGHNNFPSQKDALAMFCHSLGLPAIPFYIGKGTGGRHTNKERNKGHQLVRSFSESHGLDTQSHVILEGLTEVESLVYEGKLIDILGQRVLKTGPPYKSR